MYEREVACKQKKEGITSPVLTLRKDPATLATKYYSALPKTQDDSNLLLCGCKEALQEHPDFSSTSFYSQPACVLPAPLVQTPHPSRRASHGGGRTKDVTVWCCVCSCVCVFCVGVAAVECSIYEMMQPSMKSPLCSFKGLTWIFNDEPVSFICQIYSMTPFFLMHI